MPELTRTRLRISKSLTYIAKTITQTSPLGKRVLISSDEEKEIEINLAGSGCVGMFCLFPCEN